MENLIQEAFRRWDADKIGIPDFALESAGLYLLDFIQTFGQSKFSYGQYWSFGSLLTNVMRDATVNRGVGEGSWS